MTVGFTAGAQEKPAAPAVPVGAALPATAPTNQFPQWNIAASFGLTVMKGNSDTLQAVAKFDETVRISPVYSSSVSAGISYGELNRTKAVENYNFSGSWIWDTTDRFYMYGRADYYHDAIAHTEYRFGVHPGLGYFLLKSPAVRWKVEAAPGYTFERKGGVDDEYASYRLGEELMIPLSQRAVLIHKAAFFNHFTRLKSYNVQAEITLKTQITRKWSSFITIADSYDNVPPVGIKSNDIRLVSGLEFKF